MKSLLLLSLLAFLGLAARLVAQTPGQPAGPANPVPGQGVVVLPAGQQGFDPQWAEKMFSKTDHDFGTVARGSDAKLRIKITNRYNETIHIKSAGTTCRCFTVRIPKDTLASKESTEVEVTLDTLKFEGKREATMMVTFDRPIFAEVPIPLHAYIRKDVGLTPGGVFFGNVAQGQELNKKIQVSHVGRLDWKITELILKNDFLVATAKDTGRLNNGTTTYDLVVTLKSNAPIGEFREQLTIVTDDAASPHIPVMIEGRVEPDFYATPEVLDFGVVAPGAEVTKNLVVRGRRAFKITKIESETTLGTFETRLPKEGKVTQIVPITFMAPTVPGTITDEFSVIIDQTEVPVKFKAYAKVDPSKAPRK